MNNFYTKSQHVKSQGFGTLYNILKYKASPKVPKVLSKEREIRGLCQSRFLSVDFRDGETWDCGQKKYCETVTDLAS